MLSDIVKKSSEDILKDIDELRWDPEFLACTEALLDRAVELLNYRLAVAMLTLGADATWRESNHVDGYLHSLYWTYANQTTTHGLDVLAFVELLLTHGADPNQVGANNYRAFDLALMSGHHGFAEKLREAGATPELRPFG
ncbi:MAG: hypothetical protein R3F15_13395 [Lysobacterales bacterium]